MDELSVQPQSKYAEVCEFLETIEQCHEAHPDEPLRDERIDKYKAFVDDLMAADDMESIGDILNRITVTEAKYLSEQIYGLKITYSPMIVIAYKNAVLTNAVYAVKKYTSCIRIDMDKSDKDHRSWVEYLASLLMYSIKNRHITIYKHVITEFLLTYKFPSPYIGILFHYGTYDMLKFWIDNKLNFLGTVKDYIKCAVEAENVEIIQHLSDLDANFDQYPTLLQYIISIDSIKCFEAYPLKFWESHMPMTDIYKNCIAYHAKTIINELLKTQVDKLELFLTEKQCYLEELDIISAIIDIKKITITMDTLFTGYISEKRLTHLFNSPYVILSAKSMLSIIILILRNRQLEYLKTLLNDEKRPITMVFNNNLKTISRAINGEGDLDLFKFITNIIKDYDKLGELKWTQYNFSLLKDLVLENIILYFKISFEDRTAFTKWVIDNNEHVLLEQILHLDAIFKNTDTFQTYKQAVASNKYEVVQLLLNSYDYGLYQFNCIDEAIKNGNCDEKMIMILISTYNLKNSLHHYKVDIMEHAITREFSKVVRYLLDIKYQFRQPIITEYKIIPVETLPFDSSIDYTNTVAQYEVNRVAGTRHTISYATYYKYAYANFGKSHEITQMIKDFIDTQL